MLTADTVKALAAPAKGPKITYDHEAGDDRAKTVRGFGVRVTPQGAKSFVLNYVIARRERRYTIGSFPVWSVALARKEAGRLRQLVEQGIDPLGQREAERDAPTMANLAERYLEEHASKKRSARDDQAMIRQFILPALGSRKVAGIEYADIDRLHRKVTAAGTPVRANRVVALLSKIMALAVRWQMRDDNPARGIERNAEHGRERFLSDDEMARLKEALAAYPRRQSARAIMLILATGCRRSEATGARWAEFDLDQGVWTKPPGNTKQGTSHRVPLSAAVVGMLRDMQAERATVSPYVFPGRGTTGPMQDIKKAWTTIRTAAQIEDVHLHDLRHSFASILASQGLSLPIIGAMLGHSQAQTTNRYAHLFDAPLRDAAERVSKVVSGAKRGSPKVVALEKNTILK